MSRNSEIAALSKSLEEVIQCLHVVCILFVPRGLKTPQGVDMFKKCISLLVLETKEVILPIK